MSYDDELSKKIFKERPRVRRVIDILNIFGSVFMIVLLFVVLVNALQLSVSLFPLILNFREQMFFLAIVICIVTVLSEWIWGRTESIMKSINYLKGGKREWKKRK